MPRCRAGRAGQPPVMEDLAGYQREVVRLRVAHLLEAETGFRSGDRLHAGPGSPAQPMTRGPRCWGSGGGPRPPS